MELLNRSLPVGVSSSDETGRGREDLESQFDDQIAPVRQLQYNQARDKLQAIDPTNSAIYSLHSPDWVPSTQDIKDMQETRDRAIEDVAANVAQHGYEDHQSDFPDGYSDTELQLRAQEIIKNHRAELGTRDRTFFYDSSTNTVVIVNTVQPDKSTMFKPSDKRAFVDRNLKR